MRPQHRKRKTDRLGVDLAQTLRQRLLGTGKSQAEIGAATEIAQSTVGRFLRGTNDITLARYQRLVSFCEQHEQRARA